MRATIGAVFALLAFGCAAPLREPPITAIAIVDVRPPDESIHAPVAPAIGVEAPKSAKGTSALPFASGQTWVGTYTCPQGLTELWLHITNVDEHDVVEGVFEFEYRPSSVHGSFHVEGSYDRSKLDIDLEPGAWIEHPQHYYPVGLNGNVAGGEFWGAVTHPDCTTFSLELAPEKR